MTSLQRRMQPWAVAGAAALLFGASSLPAHAANAADLDKEASIALNALYKTNPAAQAIGEKAKAILVFPKIVKAGLIFGGGYGEGVLMRGEHVEGYYNSVAASWGWQAGAESYAYVVFLMDSKAVNYLHRSQGWEVGVGPSVVVVDQGAAKNLSSTTLKKDAYAFITDQQGLMVSLSLEGTKISHINKH